MDDFARNEYINELKTQIFNKHHSYFENDIGPTQLELRKNLEFLIRNYLYVVEHNQKFYLKETDEILQRSIRKMSDKNPAFGFESIALYAHNLFTQPWRKEYQTIRKYSGYFQHEVIENLEAGENLFFQMGYKGKPNDLLVLDPDEICPDRLRNVSRDALTAYIECQIIVEIHLKLMQNESLTIPWYQVYEVRRVFVGSVDNTIDFILDLIHRNIPIERQSLLKENTPYYSNVNCCNGKLDYEMLNHQLEQQHVDGGFYYRGGKRDGGEMDYNYRQSQQYSCLENIPSYVSPTGTVSNQFNQYSDQVDGFNMHGSGSGFEYRTPIVIRTGHPFYNSSRSRVPLPANINDMIQSTGLCNAPMHMPINYGHHSQIQANSQFYPAMNEPQMFLPPNYCHKPHSYNICPQINHQMDYAVGYADDHNTNTYPYSYGPPQIGTQTQQQSQPIVQNPALQRPLQIGRHQQNYLKNGDAYFTPQTASTRILNDYDENNTNEKTGSSRNSDFDSYEEAENLKHTTINKKNDGIGSAESWSSIYKKVGKIDLQKIHDEEKKTIETYSLDITSGSAAKSDIKSGDLSPSTVLTCTQDTVDTHKIRNEKSLKQDGNTNINTPSCSKNRQNAPTSTVNNNINNKNKKSTTQLQHHGNNNKINQFDTKSTSSVNTTKTGKKKQSTTVIEVVESWECQHCTFLNKNTSKICDMCCKTSDLKKKNQNGTATRVK